MNEELANIMGSFIETELDYIEKSNKELEQLQQENNQLTEKVINQRHALCDTNKKIHVLNARIEKAINYIDDIVPCIHDEELLDDLLKILKGE